jgi:hypothetical protein
MHVRNGELKKGRRFTPAQQAELIKSFKQRTETAREFARRRQVALCTLHRWMRQGGHRTKRTRRTRPVFEELPMISAMASWTAEVCLPDGTHLRWNRGADGASLEEVLRQLRRPC